MSNARPLSPLRMLQAQREGIDLEFKACRDQLPKNVYETVCAFLNRHGGTILLGVSDHGVATGVAPDAFQRIRKDFAAAINNPQKLTPPAYLSIDEVEVDGKSILRVYVPESSQVHRCNGRIFDRNEDGDFDITDHTAEVAAMYQRKQASYSENKVFPHLGLGDLDRDLIAKCRKIAVVRWPDHPWRDLDDLDLLKSAQLFQTIPETGKSGITLAGILLLGKQLPLLNTVSHHRTDLILRKVNVDRYDDRDFVDVNLVESYDRIMAFIAKHLPDPFYLEGTTSISIRDSIFREVASNLLIHREYTNAFPAKLIIEYGQVRTENSNRPHGFGRLDPESFTPFPKNPVIARFFRQIGRADELGSGMRKMIKYSKAYGGGEPELIEGDIFRMRILTPEFDQKTEPNKTVPAIRAHDQAHDQAHGQAHDQAHDLTKTEIHILLACLKTPQSTPELLHVLGYNSRNSHFKKAMAHLIDALMLLERTLPDTPRSKNQKYRITAQGKALLEHLK